MTEQVTKTGIEKFLQNKKVKVVPIKRHFPFLPPDHDGAFMFTGTKFTVTLPIDSRKNMLVPILTREEQDAFEKHMYKKEGDLSTYNKTNPFWASFKIELEKEGMVLDLSDPIDNLRYRILSVHPRIAPSWSERNENMAYKFALVEDDYEMSENVKRTDKLKKAYKHLGKIEDSLEQMKAFLKVYGRNNIPHTADINFLIAELGKIIESDVDGYLMVANDPSFDMKSFIADAISCKAIEKDGKAALKFKGGDRFADTQADAIAFFKDPANADIYLKVKAQIENFKK